MPREARGIVLRVTTPVPGSSRAHASAGAQVAAQTGEKCTRAISASGGAAGRLVLGGADHVGNARFEVGGNESFIVLHGVDLDIAVDRASGPPGGPTG